MLTHDDRFRLATIKKMLGLTFVGNMEDLADIKWLADKLTELDDEVKGKITIAIPNPITRIIKNGVSVAAFWHHDGYVCTWCIAKHGTKEEAIKHSDEHIQK